MPFDIQKRLFELKDENYAEFQSKLTPNVPSENFIGVRVPEVRKLAKQLAKEGSYTDFLNQLPHKYYDENMLNGLLIAEIKDYDKCIEALERFLPYVDNWAVCDTMSPQVFKKHRAQLLEKIKEWSASQHVYTCRFGIEMLMTHFLDDDFKPEYLDIPVSVNLEDYYAKMMVAWFFATALAKQWDATLPYIKDNRLTDDWTHNKTIQKARESFRITNEQKELLKTMKR